MALAPGARYNATAGILTRSECLEGSDFVANAARARDNGMTRDAFLARMEGDFTVIRGFPAAMRWFAKDRDDERLLLVAAERVFDRPQSPEAHRADFLAACLGRIATEGPASAPTAAPAPPG